MGLGTNHFTTTTQAQSIGSIFEKEAVRSREQNLVLAKLVKRITGDLQGGSTVYFSTSTITPARTKSANTEVTYDVTTESQKSISISQHKYSAKMLEDIVKMQTFVNWEKEIAWQIGQGLGEAMDLTIATLAASFTNTVGTLGSGADLGDTQLLAGLLYLDNAKAPKTDRSYVCIPLQAQALLKIDKFVKTDSIPYGLKDSPLLNYFVKQIYGVNCFSTTNLYAVATAGASTDDGNGDYSMLFQKDAIGLASQQGVKIASRYEPGFVGTQYVGSMLYGAGILRNDHGVAMLS